MSLKSLILKNNELFGKVQDFFFTNEFQQRGNEHDPGLLWIQNAPIYGEISNDEIIAFVYQYISNDSSFLDDVLLKVQTHCHKKT